MWGCVARVLLPRVGVGLLGVRTFMSLGLSGMVRVRAALVAPLLAMLAVGCTGGDDPSAEGTPTPKFSEAPSSSPASPDATASSSASSDLTSAEQLVENYLAGLSGSINDGDVQPFLQYATRGCKNCRVVARTIVDRYRGGGRIENPAGWQLVSFERVGRSPEGTGTVYTSTVDVGSQRSFDNRDKVVNRSDASTQTSVFLIKRVRGDLRIASWDVGS